MSQQHTFKLIIIGAALATVAAILVPVNVFLFTKGMTVLVIILVAIQLLLLAAAGIVLYKAHRQSRL